LVYFTAICYILWSLSISYGYLIYFSPFWYDVS
jgi:presenilin-like A22 family membrane protease